MKIMKSFDGKEIVTYLWDDVKNPKGVVQICHGMSEHSLRYEAFAKYLNANGYIVFSDDHRGFGKTDNNAGYAKGDFVGDSLKDLLFFNNMLKEKYPELPRIFFGHSYGSCLAQRFIQFDTGISVAVMTGTGYASHWLVSLAVILLSPIKLIAGKLQISSTEKSFNKGFMDTEVPHAWLTKDKEIRQKYHADPLCGGTASVSYFYGFIKLMRDASNNKNITQIRKDLPLAVYCGADDPCGSKGKTPAKLVAIYRKFGMTSVDFKLYPNDRHELLNEMDRDIVYADILTFINKSVK